MELGKSEVEYVAALSKLKCVSDAEAEKIAQGLQGILGYFRMLDELDTEGVEPLYHILESENVTRKDAAKAPMPIEEALANAPLREGRSFVLPKVL
ncbi:MAG: Asp-tRNA(Asn)/Glu-tRNA(Gln) amidotransferase subunit GatC [Eubacteriaceae bacterium]|nr:Asp-tRNA(Asn)/Glu-tRNA(Gln) amidotransferase subunit GatC [Eubacteriaceae bacterium]